ncbi:MAG TPA: glutathione synthase [Gammaproteobacteria bacterium]|jgi:glutathione synthase|nr:glutathione synthase [Chromatiales bacterium]MCP4926497.1 glutathione synthase [Gammaproteobacteria bacterium]MDP7660034.1 glutathione synthase [Gammaproteobacteria bacterium]HJP38459.1 glutathione synthase [Gammaproteobacteria bacterium]
MSNLRLGVVMDPISQINPAKDSTLAMLLEAQTRGYEIRYFEQLDLYLTDGEPRGFGRTLRVADDPSSWYELDDPADQSLADLDIMLMRKDPPFDTEYIFTTYILERAELAGTLIVNKPATLRDMNEKMFTAWFPECCPPTLITRTRSQLRAFLTEQEKIVVKPLDGMGGRSIFVVSHNDNNANVIFETLTDYDTKFSMAQKYIPEITTGDKRILLVNGQPTQSVLARIPPADDNRGNLVAGALPEARELTERDRWICAQVGPILRERGVLFAGLDVIGDYLTEINVTSPTGIRELFKLAGLDIARQLMDAVETRLGEIRGWG